MAGKNVAMGPPTIDEARSYVSTVKEAFRGEAAKFKDFKKLMNDYRFRRVDRASVVARVEQLFKDHPNLLAGFNVFLPKSEQPTQQLPTIMEADEAEDLLEKIKERFQTCDTHVPDSYVKLMEDFKERKKSEEKVKEEVIDLLYNHEDLVEEFLRLLQ